MELVETIARRALSSLYIGAIPMAFYAAVNGIA